MRMEQRIIWRHYLIIGINLFFLLIAFSCKTTDYVVKSKWIFINETQYEIEAVYHSSFKIEPFGEYSFEQNFNGPKDVNVDSYVPPNIDIIRYDGVWCNQLTINQVGHGEGPAGIQNYEYNKIEERFYEFTYRFTKEQFDQAEKCK